MCPEFEHYLVDAGIRLIKFWLEVSEPEQKRRFEARIEDPLRQWKLARPTCESRRRWYDYSRARDAMLEATDTTCAVAHRALGRQEPGRLNCISHLLAQLPYSRRSVSGSIFRSARRREPDLTTRRRCEVVAGAPSTSIDPDRRAVDGFGAAPRVQHKRRAF